MNEVAHNRRMSLLGYARDSGLLRPSLLRARRLYKESAVKRFLEDAETEDFDADRFLNRMITLEIALRTVGREV